MEVVVAPTATLSRIMLSIHIRMLSIGVVVVAIVAMSTATCRDPHAQREAKIAAIMWGPLVAASLAAVAYPRSQPRLPGNFGMRCCISDQVLVLVLVVPQASAALFLWLKTLREGHPCWMPVVPLGGLMVAASLALPLVVVLDTQHTWQAARLSTSTRGALQLLRTAAQAGIQRMAATPGALGPWAAACSAQTSFLPGNISLWAAVCSGCAWILIGVVFTPAFRLRLSEAAGISARRQRTRSRSAACALRTPSKPLSTAASKG
jgi:hypothetical protein